MTDGFLKDLMVFFLTVWRQKLLKLLSERQNFSLFQK